MQRRFCTTTKQQGTAADTPTGAPRSRPALWLGAGHYGGDCGQAEEGPYDFIDVNMGCPVPKIVNNGEGSALMKNPERAKEVITAMVKGGEKETRDSEVPQGVQ